MSLEEINDWVFTFNLSIPIQYLGIIKDSLNIKKYYRKR